MIGLLILPLFTKIADFLCSFSAKATATLESFKNKHLYWNIYLRFFFEVYLELAIISLIRIRVINFNSVGDVFLTLLALAIILVLVAYTTISMVFLHYNKDKIREEKFENRYGALVS